MIHKIEIIAHVFTEEVHQNIFRNFRRRCYEDEPELHFYQGNKSWRIINNILRGNIRVQHPVCITKRNIFRSVIKKTQPKYQSEKNQANDPFNRNGFNFTWDG
jgi:hypothetical protein